MFGGISFEIDWIVDLYAIEDSVQERNYLFFFCMGKKLIVNLQYNNHVPWILFILDRRDDFFCETSVPSFLYFTRHHQGQQAI